MSPRSFRPRESSSVSEQVVELVAEQTDTDPTDLPRLHERVDPDALDALFTPQHREPVFGGVSFTYHGHRISISYDGEVVITATPE